MTEVSQQSFCGQCNTELDELPSTPIDERKPCPKCGSMVRALRVSVSETVKVHASMELHHIEPGRKRPKAEIISGDDLHRKSGKWMNKERVIDRGKNNYREVVTDPETGEVV